MTVFAPKPIVKWAGGKTRLLPELLRRAPSTYGRYFEPFCGGAALFFELAPKRAVLADANADLIAMYEVVRDDPGDVIHLLSQHKAKHDPSYFYALRDRWNGKWFKAKSERAAAFIYLNKTCFNGLWRVNRAGAFNVPVGRYTNPPICMPDILHAASGTLKQAELRHADYQAVVADAKRGDFVYFDPPYDPVNATSNFTSYTAGSFGAEDQRSLAELVRTLVARGVHVMLSNSDTPFVRELYQGFKIDRVQCARAINAKASKRGVVDELIITGGLP